MPIPSMAGASGVSMKNKKHVLWISTFAKITQKLIVPTVPGFESMILYNKFKKPLWLDEAERRYQAYKDGKPYLHVGRKG